MIGRFLFVVVLALACLGSGTSSARPRAPSTCLKEIGPAAARRLAQDCRDAAPMSPALCQPETPCTALRELIEDACENPGSEMRPVCGRYGDAEDSDEEDDE